MHEKATLQRHLCWETAWSAGDLEMLDQYANGERECEDDIKTARDGYRERVIVWRQGAVEGF